MRYLVLGILATMVGLSTPALAQDIKAGARITVSSDWHSQNGGPYSPQIVSCKSSSGLCLKDKNVTPTLSPMAKTKHGLQIVFKEANVVYLFKPKGKGTFYNLNGKKLGSFKWDQ